jgi:hypothetical protein
VIQGPGGGGGGRPPAGGIGTGTTYGSTDPVITTSYTIPDENVAVGSSYPSQLARRAGTYMYIMARAITGDVCNTCNGAAGALAKGTDNDPVSPSLESRTCTLCWSWCGDNKLEFRCYSVTKDAD